MTRCWPKLRIRQYRRKFSELEGPIAKTCWIRPRNPLGRTKCCALRFAMSDQVQNSDQWLSDQGFRSLSDKTQSRLSDGRFKIRCVCVYISQQPSVLICRGSKPIARFSSDL
jgi:hypothetical protein